MEGLNGTAAYPVSSVCMAIGSTSVLQQLYGRWAVPIQWYGSRQAVQQENSRSGHSTGNGFERMAGVAPGELSIESGHNATQ